jgi:hypothetical protein
MVCNLHADFNMNKIINKQGSPHLQNIGRLDFSLQRIIPLSEQFKILIKKIVETKTKLKPWVNTHMYEHSEHTYMTLFIAPVSIWPVVWHVKSDLSDIYHNMSLSVLYEHSEHTYVWALKLSWLLPSLKN